MILYNVKYGYIKDPHVYDSQHLEQADIIWLCNATVYTQICYKWGHDLH